MSRIFLTGAAGCLGSALALALAKEGHTLSVLLKPDRWNSDLDGLPLTVFRGDIRDAEAVRHAMQGCELAYQVAGVVSYALIDSRNIYSTHVQGVENVLRTAGELGLRKVVVTASTAGIGIPGDSVHPLTEDAPFDKPWYRRVAYMHSKHFTIQACKRAAQTGIPAVCVSPTTFYGQGDRKMHVGKIAKSIAKGTLRAVPPGGNAVVSVDDVVSAHLLAMEKGVPGENYIVANEFLSYKELFAVIARILGVTPVTRVSPRWTRVPVFSLLLAWERALLLVGERPTLPAYGCNFTYLYRYFDASKIRRELGWEPMQTFEQAMTTAIEYYGRHGLL